MRKIFFAAAAALLVGSATAAPIRMDFTVDIDTPGLPDVSGWFTYDASATGEILAVTGIDLTIEGHAYTLPEVGFFQNGTHALIGALVFGVNAASTGAHDFFVAWDRNTLDGFFMAYGTPDTTRGLAGGTPVVRFTNLDANAVPEPASMALAALALGAAGIARRRKKS